MKYTLLLLLILSEHGVCLAPPLISALPVPEQMEIISENKDKVYRKIVEEAGGLYLSFKTLKDKDYIFFNDPVTKSTITLTSDGFSVEAVKQAIEAKRKEFGL